MGPDRMFDGLALVGTEGVARLLQAQPEQRQAPVARLSMDLVCLPLATGILEPKVAVGLPVGAGRFAGEDDPVLCTVDPAPFCRRVRRRDQSQRERER